jgi:hypothetical protein
MAESEFSCNHYETTGPQETRKVLPNCSIQKGSAVETNCNSHEVPNSRTHESGEDRSALGKVDGMDIDDTNEMVQNRVADELQPLKAEKEQVFITTAILVPM